MRRFARENALCALMAAAGCALIGWLGLYGFAWNDYDDEARPAVEALVHAHPGAFLRLAPAYGGSLLERAPFALAPGVWGGGALAVYRMLALPCLLASAALGVWLVARMRARRSPPLARAVALGLCVANPITLRALEVGHPEELLGGCLCVAAVLLAAERRCLWAGAALGLAVANKEWALLAAGPVALALPPGRRLGPLALAAAAAAALTAPFALVSGGTFGAAARGVAVPTGAIFQPWQAWWFLGRHGALVHGLFGAPKPGYRIGPAWASAVSHPLILLLALLATVALALRLRGRPMPASDALLALALLLLMRCLLDTWDTVYYALPLLLALLAWETLEAPARPPLLALSSTMLVWTSFVWLPEGVSPDAQSAVFLAWTVPLAAVLALRLARGAPQASTVSSLGRFVRSS